MSENKLTFKLVISDIDVYLFLPERVYPLRLSEKHYFQPVSIRVIVYKV